VVERQIGGKIFKLGRFLSQEEQDEVAAVISRHLDAFAWTTLGMPGIDPDFCASTSPWMSRFALYDRGGGSSMKRDASS